MRLNLLVVGLIAMLVFLQYRLWYQPAGINDMFLLRKKIAQQVLENEKLKLSNEELLFEIKRLQNSEDSAEYRARSELGMIKKDETYYQVIEGK